MTDKIDPDSAISPKAVIEVRNAFLQATVAERTEYLKTKTAAWISGIALAIGAFFLCVAVYQRDGELKAWATGLISLIVGAAVGFIFAERTSGD